MYILTNVLICKLYNRLTFSVMEEQYPTLVVYGVCFMVCVHVAALVSFFIAINRYNATSKNRFFDRI